MKTTDSKEPERILVVFVYKNRNLKSKKVLWTHDVSWFHDASCLELYSLDADLPTLDSLLPHAVAPCAIPRWPWSTGMAWITWRASGSPSDI